MPLSVFDWSEAHVNQFFLSLGLNRYEVAIKEHAVTGDVLVHLDNELLKDIGIHSVGKRLAILKAIYKLKLRQDIPIEDGHWVPPLGDVEMDDSDDAHSASSASPTPQHLSLSRLIQARDEKISALESEIRAIKVDLQSFASRLLASSPTSPNSHMPEAPPGQRQGRHMREESMSQLVIPEPPSNLSPVTPHYNGPTMDDHTRPSPSSTLSGLPRPSLLSSPSSSTLTSQSRPSPASSALNTPHEASFAAQSTSADPLTTTPTAPKERASERSPKDKDPNNPYKSFRVTLEDPCYKVLPAALKKYKIKEHYKNYVLFICYGKQERCLSYEEKPLLLFQKLKEAHQNPVFTLRHIKDIESPISIALAKQVQRREKRLAGGAKSGGAPRRAPASLGSVEPASGFCIAIYPYMSEGEEDFDVGVGDTFLIVGKSKGWWVVIRDLGNDSAVSTGTEESKGWIPSGCVLETSKSFTIGRTGRTDYSTRIMPEEVLSVSSVGHGLMEWKGKSCDELEMDNGDALKVYKKYNNWSYAINESKPNKPRGWAPSWLIGTRKEGSSGSAGSVMSAMSMMPTTAGSGPTPMVSAPTSVVGTTPMPATGTTSTATPAMDTTPKVTPTTDMAPMVTPATGTLAMGVSGVSGTTPMVTSATVARRKVGEQGARSIGAKKSSGSLSVASSFVRSSGGAGGEEGEA